MFKITYQVHGSANVRCKVFNTREETDKFVGLNLDNFAMIKIVEVFH